MEFNYSPDLDGKPQRADYRRLVDSFFPVNFTDDPNKIYQFLCEEYNNMYSSQIYLYNL